MSTWLLPLLAAASLIPGVSPAIALVAGVLLALTFGNPYIAKTRKYAKTLLSVAIIGLGADMDLVKVARVGAEGIVTTFVSIALCLTIGMLIARVLRVPWRTGMLLSVGTAICGGSAIAAVSPVVRAKDHEIAVALAVVFLLNALGLFLFPPLGHLFGMAPRTFGYWAALAIHDTSSVVGAGRAYGAGEALEVATTVKLARALWIVPLTFALAALVRRFGAKLDAGETASTDENAAKAAKHPLAWFIAGFLAMAALVTYVAPLRPAGHVVALCARQVLSLTLFLIGAGLTRAALKSVGVRPLVHGVALWLISAVGTFAAIRAGLIGG